MLVCKCLKVEDVQQHKLSHWGKMCLLHSGGFGSRLAVYKSNMFPRPACYQASCRNDTEEHPDLKTALMCRHLHAHTHGSEARLFCLFVFWMLLQFTEVSDWVWEKAGAADFMFWHLVVWQPIKIEPADLLYAGRGHASVCDLQISSYKDCTTFKRRKKQKMLSTQVLRSQHTGQWT